jgi:hypothetical protein
MRGIITSGKKVAFEGLFSWGGGSVDAGFIGGSLRDQPSFMVGMAGNIGFHYTRTLREWRKKVPERTRTGPKLRF